MFERIRNFIEKIRLRNSLKKEFQEQIKLRSQVKKQVAFEQIESQIRDAIKK